MGSHARNFVLVHRRAGGFAQAVLAYLADCMNDQSGRCDPTRETIAEYFSAKDDPCTVKRVERALARLRTLGYIESKRVPYTRQTSAGQEGGWRNSYVLVGFVPGDSNAVRVTDISDVTPKTDVTPAMERGHPQNVQGVTPNLERGHPQNGGINQKEPEENQKEPVSSMRTSSANAAVASAQAQTPYPEDFDQSLFDEAQREAQLAGEKTTDEPPMKEEKPKRKRSSNVQKPESVSEQVWNDFTALRTKRRAPITETALKGIQREAEKAGITLEEALSTCCERGWQGFKAEWYSRATAKSSSPAPSSGGRYLTAQERYEERMRKAGEMSDAEYMAQFLRPTPLEIEARQRKNHESA